MMASFQDYFILTKPRVVLLMLLTVWVGMYLASTDSIPLSLWIGTTAGIALLCGGAATFNHIIDRKHDALMERTKHRPLVRGILSVKGAVVFAMLQTFCGFLILYCYVNTLTAVLTLLASIGYGAIYSLYLKRATPQNIVIGGLPGAMPPLLGWTAVSEKLSPEGWLLVLIIFTWTPAHFWALCLHRYEEYQQSPFPMLPITHGVSFTQFNILLYSILTVIVSLFPFIIGMSGEAYFYSALLLGFGLLWYAFKLQKTPANHPIALKTFHFSLIYLTGLFIALLLDHHLLVN